MPNTAETLRLLECETSGHHFGDIVTADGNAVCSRCRFEDRDSCDLEEFTDDYEPKPIGRCPKCRTWVYSVEGFCGTCEPWKR